MNKNHESPDLIELGAASLKTKGTPFGMDDLEGGRQPHAGIGDDE